MPRGNGTGSVGGDRPATGRGGGRRKPGNSGSGRGRMGGPFAAGPGGNCVCPQCGYKISHTPGQPCNQLKCTQCNTVMTRE